MKVAIKIYDMGLTKLKYQYGKLSNNFHSQQSIEAFPFGL